MNFCYESENIVENYVKYRPPYSKAIASIIIDYIKTYGNNCWETIVDVACGSGQCTQLLGPYFNKVYGFDVSKKQIEMAKRCHGDKGFHFEVSLAEDLPVSSESVDLVSCSCAAHWLNYDQFLAETWRILKPGGVLTIFTYLPGEFTDKNGQKDNFFCVKANRLLDKFHSECHAHPVCIKHCFNQDYDDIYEDCVGINKTSNTSVVLVNNWSLQDIIGHFLSYDGYETYVNYTKQKFEAQGEIFGDKDDILKHFIDGIRELLGVEEGVENDRIEITFTFRTRVILSTKAKK